MKIVSVSSMLMVAAFQMAWPEPPQASPAAVDYLAQIKPILAANCYACHGSSQQKKGLRLDTSELARRGGQSGPALQPGAPGESLLVRVVKGTHAEIPRMPYKKPVLSDTAIALIERWIAEGAKGPENEQPEKRVHWAFQGPNRPELPPITEQAWPRNPIDHFILAAQNRHGLKPSPEADKVTLLRRLSLDLTGLPPSPVEVEEFLADGRPEAYEQWVDRLLASPHYGERWGRLWLDGARYADSNGYSIDAPRSVWKYRDWVIQALNEDKPFDQFVVAQMAGDLLPDPELEQRTATGFHRQTQINQEGGIDPEEFRVQSVLDRVNTTGTVFLGLTVGCAQCHDHKFDPISQKEYYQLYAFFNNTVDEGHGKPAPGGLLEIPTMKPDEPEAESEPAAESSEKPPANEAKKTKPTTTLVMVELDKPRPTAVFIKGDFTRPGEPVEPGVPSCLHPLERKPNRTGAPNRLDLAEWLVDRRNPLLARVTVNRIWQQYFGRGLVETENDFGTQGSLPSHPELLDWLACELMETSFRQGQSGMGSGAWSLKKIHRLIVTSSVYRQSSRARADLTAVDPLNLWLGRQARFRLDAEMVRDIALRASGLLDPRIGGPSVFPPQPDGVMKLGQVKREWKPSRGGDRFRRGIYTFWWRATPHPALAVFDAPDAFSPCTRRLRSNTPLQALTLLNDEAFFEFARVLAERIVNEISGPDPVRMERAFQLCLARRPHPEERERLLALLESERVAFAKAPEEADAMVGKRSSQAGAATLTEKAAWTSLARVLLNLDETITRE